MDFLVKIALIMIFAYNLKMKNFTKCLLGIVLTQFSPSILAAVESYQSIPTQELIIESKDQILLKNKVIKITPKQIIIEDEFYNGTDQPIEAQVSFIVPTYECNSAPSVTHAINTHEDVASWFRSAAFTEFNVAVDEKKIQILNEQKAIQNEREISHILKKLGVSDINCPDISEFKPDVKKKLETYGFIQGMYHTHNGLISGAWKIQRRYKWNMTFPAKKITKVVHSYDSRLGIFQIEHGDFRGFFDELMNWARTNSNPNTLKHGTYYFARTKESGLKKPIENVEVIIEGGQLVWAYVGGDMYSGIGRVKVFMKDYLPTEDIFFAFGQSNKEIPAKFHDKQTIKDKSNLLLAPFGKILSTLEDKSSVEVVDYISGWFKIKFNEKIGFLQEQHLETTSLVKGKKYYMSKNSAPNCLPDSPPHIRLISPNGGEKFKEGQKVKVKWQSCNVTPPLIIFLGQHDLPQPYSAKSEPGGSGSGVAQQLEDDGEEEITLPIRYDENLKDNNFHLFMRADHDVYTRFPQFPPEDYTDGLFTIKRNKPFVKKPAVQDIEDLQPNQWQ